MWQFWQIACAICTSSEISVAHSPWVFGSGLVFPFSLILRKQPFAAVQAGNPNALSYTARSASAVGSENASTSAIVWAEEPGVSVGNE